MCIRDSPRTGTNELAGDQSGLDASLRPMWPVLYLTDVTADPNSHAGDWQLGGLPVAPTAIFGAWKGAVRTVDKRTTPNHVTITPDPDPAKNNWKLCLLYTSDAADERSSVDLGGRRIIKK